MNIIIQVSQLLLSLSLLILLHELGHFLFARLFNTRVEKFYLFFDPWFSLFKIKKGDTEYGIGWLPLGGYVKISGMIDESMDKEAMKQPPKPYEFRSKPAWQRLLIMLGGVMVNVLLGFVIYGFVLFVWGEKYLPTKNVKDGIWVTDSILNEIGLQTGDKIISINGKQPERFSQILEEMLYAGEMRIERDGKDTTLVIPTDFPGLLSDNRIHNKGPIMYVRMPFIITEIPDTSLNVDAGFKPKDKIISINGNEITYFDEYAEQVKDLKGKEVTFIVERDGKNEEVAAIIGKDGKIGVGFAFLPLSQLEKLGYYELATLKYGLLESIGGGINKGKEKLKSYVRQFKLIFNFDTGAHKGIGGFGAIAGLFPAQWDWQYFWEITAFLSIMLAFLNVLPIPALDGGHVMFLFYEIITGRKPGDKFMEYAQMVGMVLLLMLLLYANGNDIYRKIISMMGGG